ncbi:MAG TPA: Crp/Fnr family transcriptional regulator [Chryseosolibacter sp.]|nr:Crp/Fnr family transcriptional regulator [Chryseosolibacter sp.]
MDHIGLLRNYLHQFQLLTNEEVELIVTASEIECVEKGTILLEEGQVSNKCHFLLKGCVREYVIKDGDEKTTGFYTEGQALDPFSPPVNPPPSKYNLVCVEDCVFAVSKSTLVEEMCRIIPRLETLIVEEVQRNGMRAQDEISRFITSSPEERYLYLLENRPDLLNRVPQHQIASYIGVTPESLSRIRKRMTARVSNTTSVKTP